MSGRPGGETSVPLLPGVWLVCLGGDAVEFSVFRAQFSVVWSTLLQMAHGVIGASACDAMYAGFSWSHFAVGPGLLRWKTWLYCKIGIISFQHG